MAGRAVIRDPGMVEGCRYEAGGIMADAAILVGSQMSAAFRRCEPRIVARRTVIDDARMIEGSRQEARRHMTIGAITVRGHVVA